MSAETEYSNRSEVFRQMMRYRMFDQILNTALEILPPPEVIDAYRQYRSVLEEMYGYGNGPLENSLLYHGSGYERYEGNKYHDTPGNDTVPVLEQILESGLGPSEDHWLLTPGNVPTLSLTRARFYAKWYADLFQGKHNPLLWEYGDSADWAMKYLFDSWRTDPLPAKLLDIFLTKKRDDEMVDGLELFRRFVRNVRNDISHDTKYIDIFRGHSTIDENFGAIFVIREHNLPTIDMIMIKAYEERTLFPVSPKQFIAVEVPLTKVDSMNEMAQQHGLGDLIVLPMECVDLHFSHFPLRHHMVDIQRKTQSAGKVKRTENVDFLSFDEITRDQLETAASGDYMDTYHPHYLLKTLEQSPFFRQQFSRITGWEGHTLRYHTLSVLLQFEKYFSDLKVLPGNVRKEFFRIFLSLHDSGDMVQNGEKKLRNNQVVASTLLRELQFPDHEVRLAEALLSDDLLGEYIKRAGTIHQLSDWFPLVRRISNAQSIQSKIINFQRKTVGRIRTMARQAHMSNGEFISILELYHMVDAGSYTTDGGTIGSLNYMFIFDPLNKTMRYVPAIQQVMESLKTSVTEE